METKHSIYLHCHPRRIYYNKHNTSAKCCSMRPRILVMLYKYEECDKQQEIQKENLMVKLGVAQLYSGLGYTKINNSVVLSNNKIRTVATEVQYVISNNKQQ